MVAIDNYRQVINFKKLRIIYHIVLVILIVLIIFLLDNRPDLQVPMFSVIIFLYFVGLLTVLYLRPGYFRMTIVNDNELQIRYFNLHIYNGKPKAIQFHVSEMKDYIIEKKPFGKRSLVLKIRSSDQIATYPPISIYLLGHKQQQFLRSFLDKINSEAQ